MAAFEIEGKESATATATAAGAVFFNAPPSPSKERARNGSILQHSSSMSPWSSLRTTLVYVLSSLVVVLLIYSSETSQTDHHSSSADTGIGTGMLRETDHRPVNAPANAPKRVFCFGDSLTAGTSPPGRTRYPYAVYLEEALQALVSQPTTDTDTDTDTTTTAVPPPPTVLWKGFPGWTSVQLLHNAGLENLLRPDSEDATTTTATTATTAEDAPTVDLLIVLAGTNDLPRSTDRSSQPIVESLQAIHRLALDPTRGHVGQTLALGIPTSAYQERNEPASALATQINQELQEWAQTQDHVTYLPFPIATFDRSSDLWSTDGLHLSEKGYQFVGKSLAPTVAQLLWNNE